MLIDKKTKNEFKNKKILITGGTGSIGLGLIKQLLKLQPKTIRIFSNDENSIFEIKKRIGDNPIFTYLMGDIRDKDRLTLAIRGIDIVFHAAAMKHVDICEQNPFDAVKTNVLGTSNILEVSLLENISKFILISTDKATNPTSTLGASKLLAERLTINATSYKGSGRTKFTIVRFGNVIGSRGSVFQIFLDQIKHNQPLTVTDKRMTRFIMSIPEAANLILRVTAIANDGEIFILKMPSVKIADLANKMSEVCGKRFSGNNNASSIKILESREGERFHEFLITNEELPFCHEIKDMYKINNKKNPKTVEKKSFSSETAPEINNKKLEKIINELLDEYLPF
jgi:FlaA1/EpsC-like NDP-sugar epimerase